MKTKIYFTLFMLLSGFAGFGQTPTSTKNYIVETTVKVSGKTNESQLAGLPVSDANRTIQYFDGLGRAEQSVQWKASPLQKDIVQVKEYDAMGREAKKYLPYAEQASNDGSFKASGLTSQASFYGTSSPWDANVAKTPYPYSLTVFEASPLSRLQQQGAPGAVWQPYNAGISGSGHTTKVDYGTNTATEAQLWTVTSTGAATSSSYPAGRLFKTVTKDENWTSGKIGTTEEFEDFNGRVVLKKTWETESVSLNTYYVYDAFGNLKYVIPPGVNTSTTTSFTESDVVFFNFIYAYHYDNRKRLIEKKIPGKGWELYCYNKLDQVIYSKDANLSGASKWLFTKYDALGRVIITGINKNVPDGRATLQTLFDAHTGSLWESRAATTDGYTVNMYPKVHVEDPNVEFHIINYYDDYSFPGFSSTYNATGTVSTKTRGMLTGTKTRILGSDVFLLTVFYYDEDGRLIETIAQNQLTNGFDKVRNTYNFAGELTASVRSHIKGATTTTIANGFTYDHAGRKISTTSNINSQGVVTLNKLEYNEIGLLKQKHLHSTDGTNFLQNTKYAYNERGWLKRSISAELQLKLAYDTLSNPQYNGNIATQEWGSSFGNKFLYTYDRLNRLTNGTSTGTVMSEVLTYDKMGNINTISRDGDSPRLYVYTGNMLNYVEWLTLSYNYDNNGNATTDGRNGMTLRYNHLNLPDSAYKTGVNVGYRYNATGQKLRKISGSTITQYVNGIQYTGSTIDFIATEEGIAFNNAGTYTYRYNLTDHLGNVRYTFDKFGSTLRRLQSDDYYAFGKRKSGSPVSLDNKYLYNGKEVQDELGEQYDYGARFYDPVIGRWNSIDPLAEKMFPWSTYNYVESNPINKLDEDGRSGEAVIDKQNKTITVTQRLVFYGGGANENLSKQTAAIVAAQWNGAHATVDIDGVSYKVNYKVNYMTVSENYAAGMARNNTDIENNFIRVEDGSSSSKMQIGGNAGWFNTKDNLGNSTTPAHEIGHGLGLSHSPGNQSNNPDRPDIMTARGSKVDKKWGSKGTNIINPDNRRVTDTEVKETFKNVTFDKDGKAKIGTMTNNIYDKNGKIQQ